MTRLTAFTLPLVIALTAALCGASPDAKMNVLFISADDMRPQLGCYGDAVVKTPGLDRLASRGLLFNRAYCQQALCSSSRISFFSGSYPATTEIYTIGPNLREKLPDVI